jgi:hypothetical protein
MSERRVSAQTALDTWIEEWAADAAVRCADG